jgi:hypothetical protein
MKKAFLIFVLLQAADLITTAVALELGGAERNPIVLHLMGVGPVGGVVLAKVISLSIGIGCVLASRPRALQIANVVFAGIVIWNLSIIVRLVQRA